MKKLAGILLLLSFASVSLFGFSMMLHGDHGMALAGRCLAADLQGLGTCENTPGTIDYIAYHFAALTGLLLAVLGTIFIFSFALAVASRTLLDFIRKRHLFSRRNDIAEGFPPLRIFFTRWLSLHENSPALS